MMKDKVVLNFRELQLKWAVDEATDAVQKLIPIIERIKDEELLTAVSEYLQAIHNYVTTVERIRNDL